MKAKLAVFGLLLLIAVTFVAVLACGVADRLIFLHP
jgi:flagellin-like protein